MSDLIEQVARNQFSIVQQGEMSWLVKWRGEIEDEFACLKDAEEWITLAVANVSAALRELSAKHEADWTSLLSAVCDVYALLDEEWEDAEPSDIAAGFDPWQALREIKSRLSAKLEGGDTRWEDWRKQLLDAWAKDHRAT